MSEREQRLAAGESHLFAAIFTPEQRRYAHRMLAEIGDDGRARREFLALMLVSIARGEWPAPRQAGTSGATSGTPADPGPEAGQGPGPRPAGTPYPPVRPRRPADDDRE